jgi:hypothetical protein
MHQERHHRLAIRGQLGVFRGRSVGDSWADGNLIDG